MMRKISNDRLGRPTTEEYRYITKNPVTVILDNIRSLNNVGSFFRTCDAFAMEKVLLCGITAVPPHRDIHKTALGAESTVPWEYFKDTGDAVRKVTEQGYLPVAVEQVEGAVMLEEFEVRTNGRYALIFGNEVFGVSQQVVDLCAAAIEIPQSGTKHSLNVAVSGGVVLWHFYSSFLRKP